MAVKDNTYKFAVPTCRTIIEQNDGKKLILKRKVKGAVFSFVKWSTLEGGIKIVQLTLQRTVCVIHSCSPRLSQTCVLSFPKNKKIKATIQAFHDDNIHIQQFRNFWQDDNQLNFNTKDQQRKIIINLRLTEKQKSFPVKQRYAAWRKQVTNVYTQEKSFTETR